MTNNKNNNSYSYKKSYKFDKNVKIYDFSEKKEASMFNWRVSNIKNII